jgi:hypothetical protein
MKGLPEVHAVLWAAVKPIAARGV